MTGVVNSTLYEGTCVEWEIKHYRDLPQKEGDYLHSPSFLYSGVNWHLSIAFHPPNWISIFLESEEFDNLKRVATVIEIKHPDGSAAMLQTHSITRLFYCCCHRVGVKQFIDRTTLVVAAFMFRPSITIFCSFHIIPEHTEQASKSSGNFLQTLSENLKQLYLSKCGDVKIKVGDREFEAHKSVLSARSRVFSCMFDNDMTERNSGIIEISDCDEDAFEDFLIFVYSGQLQQNISGNAASLYKIADKYELEELKRECVRQLRSDLSTDSVCDVIQLAAFYSETDLLKKATNFFVDNAKYILSSQKWRMFLQENIELGNELFIKYVNRYSK